MNEDFGFSPQWRGAHRLMGRTVVQIMPSLDPADFDRAALDVVGALAEAGARALVAGPAGPLVSELQAKGGVWIPFPASTKNPVAMALNVNRLRQMLQRERVELVHVRSRPAAWVAWAATRSAKTAFVTTMQQIAPGNGLLQQRYNSVMARGDIVMVGSRFAASTIPALYPWAVDRISLIRPGVDFHGLSPSGIGPARVQALRQIWQVAPDERIILLAGRPSLWKGHKVLVEAARLLADQGHKNIKVILTGDTKGKTGPVRDIEQAIVKAGMEKTARWAGPCADMPAALLAAAAVVIPSLEAEAFGRIAVEAQALGTPVIVSDLGAVPETVLAPPDVEPARRTGWRVPANDPISLAEAIAEALALGASSRDALAARARKQVEERFSIDRMARQTLVAYAALLDRSDQMG
jgi:glycosyltransferase involved in cell wall biosynthesis